MPPKVRYQVRGTTEILAKLKLLRATAPKIMGQALFTSSMRILVPAMKRRLLKNKSRFQGALHQSIGAKVEVGAETGKASVLVGTFNDFPLYTMNIERGSRAHKVDGPERKRLDDWVRLKLNKSGEAHKAALAGIIKSIGEVGTKKKPFIVPVFKEKQKSLTVDFFARLRVQLGLRAS